MTPCLKNALAYAAKGWKLFPAVYKPETQRHQALVKWSIKATDDPETIKGWAQRHPKAYFCAAVLRSDLTVLDVDDKNNKRGPESLAALIKAKGPLPETLTVRTPSGGCHLVFKGFTRYSVGALGAGLDTPVMIPLPGSDVAGKGAYKLIAARDPAPLPEWLKDELGKTREKSLRRETPAVDEDLPENIIRAVEYLQEAPPSIEGEGGDNALYAAACGARDFALSRDTCLMLLAKYFNPRCEPPWDAEDLEAKVDNAYAYARSRAGEDLPERAFVETPSEDTVLKDAGSITSRSIAPPKWVLAGRLIRGFTTVTVAPGGVGKSALAITESLAVASGRDLTECGRVAPGAVWLYNTEDPEDEMRRRILAAAVAHGIRLKDLPHRFFFSSSRTHPLVLVSEERRGLTVNPTAIRTLIDNITKHNITVLMMDPFIRCHRVKENDNHAIDLVAQQFDIVAQATGCAVSVFHHTKKGTNGAGDIESSRGASALVNAARIAHTLTPMQPKEGEMFGLAGRRYKWYARLDDAKVNLSPPGENTQWFEKESVDLFNDEGSTVVALKRGDPGGDMQRSDQRAVRAAVKELMEGGTHCGLREMARRIKDAERYLLSDKHEETLARIIIKCLEPPMDTGDRLIWYEEIPGAGTGKRTQRVIRARGL